jgi:hypothetical protein
MNAAKHGEGITLRRAALVTGVGLLIMVFAAPFSEYFVHGKLVVPDNIEETVQNILANRGLFLAGISAYMITFICDVVVAWALYFLLRPTNRSMSLLAAWFRLVYTTMAFVALLKLVTVLRLLNTPDYRTAFGTDQLHAQVKLLLGSFRYEWSTSLMLFGIHLGLVGYLVYRSGYIPRVLGILLAIAGLGWLVYEVGPYLAPTADFRFIMITFFGEVVFMLWLLVRGRRIKEPIPQA